MEEFKFSSRRACKLAGIAPSGLSRRPRPDRRPELRRRLIELARKHKRHGCRMLRARLRCEGFEVNVKVVERLCREEKLQVLSR